MRKLIVLLLVIGSMTSCQKAKVSDLEETVYVRRNGADMPAYIRGNGSENIFLIILHGGPGGSGLEYRSGGYSDDLEKQYAVVYWDQRGQGMSQGHFSKEDLSLLELAKDVRALALVLKHKYGEDSKLFLMGHSWGGMIGTAALVTEDFQTHFKGWIDVDGVHDFPALYRSGAADMIRVGKEQIQLGNEVNFWGGAVSFAEGLDTTTVDLDLLGELNAKGQEAESRLEKSGVVEEAEGSLKGLGVIFQNNFITSAVAGVFTSWQLFNEHKLHEVSLTEDLKKITIPTLLLWGKYDMVVSPQLGNLVFNNIGATEKKLVIFDRSGHSPMVSEPDKFVSEVSDFIDSNK